MAHVPPDSVSGAGPAGPQGPAGAPTDPLRSILQALRPPGWVIDELQNKLVLFLNHVLQQEPAATERLRRQAGKPLRVQWGDFHFCVAPTRAGLLERVDPVQHPPELTVSLTQTSPAELARRMLAGEVWVRLTVSSGGCSSLPKWPGWWTTCAGTWRKTSRA